MKKCTGCARRRAKMKKAINGIFTPSKNIYFPNRNWGMKKYQRGILHPIGFWADAGGGTAAFDEEMTVAGRIYCSYGTSDDFFIDGYNVGNYDYHNDSAYGSITGTTYTDGTPATRTVSCVWTTESGGAGCPGGEVGISLQGTLANSADRFVDCIIDNNSGTPITRTRVSATFSQSNGGTHWRWSGTGPTTGVRTVQLVL